MLGHRERERGVGGGVDLSFRVVGVHVAVGEPKGYQCAAHQILLNAERRSRKPLDQRAGAGGETAGLGRGVVRKTESAGQRGIQARGGDPDLSGAGSDIRLEACGGRGAGDAGRGGEHAGGHRAGESSGVRAQQVVIRHLRPVALDFQIDVVLQRQRDGVLQRKVQVAAAQ